MRLLFLVSVLVIGLLFAGLSLALGNHPSAGACGSERPWFAICTHSLHSLEGWHADDCHKDRAAAEKDAEEHAKEYHKGNTRWTGIMQSGGTPNY